MRVVLPCLHMDYVGSEWGGVMGVQCGFMMEKGDRWVVMMEVVM